MNKKILQDVNEYYTQKINDYGASPLGVDWNSEASQIIRFEQLSQVINPASKFCLLDIGCGYGALYDYLKCCHYQFDYLGLDVSQEMIDIAIKEHQDLKNANFYVGDRLANEAINYTLASGIFNVRLEHSSAEWMEYIKEVVYYMNTISQNGFSFNCLTSYSDQNMMKDYLYYADPCFWFDFCKTHFSRNVALLHDYTLYEFTVIVRKI